MSKTHERQEDPRTDEQLVREARGGDPAAYEVLVGRYQQRIFNLVARVTGRAELVDDLAQEAFIKAYEKLGHFRFESSFYTWLYAIAVNTCRNHYRRRRGSTVSIDDREDDGLGLQLAASEEQAPDLQASRRERAALVRRALDELPDEQREALVMCDLEGLGYQEIADVLGIPIGTVRSRIFRARSQMRALLPADMAE